jgi:hypothetical protein
MPCRLFRELAGEDRRVAAMNKFLAPNSKSRTEGKATKDDGAVFSCGIKTPYNGDDGRVSALLGKGAIPSLHIHPDDPEAPLGIPSCPTRKPCYNTKTTKGPSVCHFSYGHF